MFRKATAADIDRITEIYDRIHTEEEAGRTTIGWVRSIYPTRKTAEDAVSIGEMFVQVINGEIVAAAKINQQEVAEYANATWQYPAPPERIMVLHTLVVDPAQSGKGYGKRFVAFYEEYALKMECPYLRMDTNIKNQKARAMYKNLGYTEVSVVDSFFNGIAGVKLVCLEKKL